MAKAVHNILHVSTLRPLRRKQELTIPLELRKKDLDNLAMIEQWYKNLGTHVGSKQVLILMTLELLADIIRKGDRT